MKTFSINNKSRHMAYPKFVKMLSKHYPNRIIKSIYINNELYDNKYKTLKDYANLLNEFVWLHELDCHSIGLALPSLGIFYSKNLELKYTEDVLNFTFFDDLNVIKEVYTINFVPILLEGYPTTKLDQPPFCCDHEYICKHAITKTHWDQISNDPSEANFFCTLYNKEVWGEDPPCKR